MEYKIFYSYQTDIREELNEKFIKTALKKATKELSDNFEIIKGFGRISGNPPLLETMLLNNSECDIFVGDITLTSSRHEHPDIFISEELRKEQFSRLKGTVKMSPNPNVLVEAGYSWAKHDFRCTILVANIAFGDRTTLPVDLIGLRGPISYNLPIGKLEDPQNYKTQLSELVSSLKQALSAAISHVNRQRVSRYSPFKLIENWKDARFKNEFIKLEELNTMYNEIKERLFTDGLPQRLVGSEGVGKSRFIFELFRMMEEPERIKLGLIVFYDLKDSHYTSIEKQLLDLAGSLQESLLIVDNCSSEIHSRLVNDLLDSKTKLLTIGRKFDNDSVEATLIITSDISDEIIRHLAERKVLTIGSNEVLQFAHGNLNKAIRLLNSEQFTYSGVDSTTISSWEQILGRDIYEGGGLIILKAVSIFTQVGINNRFKNQAQYIARILCNNIPFDNFLSILTELEKLQIVKFKGDFVIVESFAEELSVKWISEQTISSLTIFVSDLNAVNLSKAFGARIKDLAKNASNRAILENFLKLESIKSFAFVNTEEGSKVILTLAEIFPDSIIKSLQTTFDNKTTEELALFKNGRRNIVWTLEKLIFRKESFSSSANLLFRLALAENEDFTNNATGQFVQLFQPILSGTEVSLKTRFSFLKSLYKEEDKVKNLLLLAASRGLMTSGYIRTGGSESFLGETLKDFVPTQPEINQYWESMIKFLAMRIDEA